MKNNMDLLNKDPWRRHMHTVVLLVIFLFISCNGNKNPEKHTPQLPAFASHVVHPGWSKNATIYEVNIRQYTPEGTLKAFEAHLPRLQELGVDILWLMPVFPIGEINRKGTLGSYYAVKDYLAVNPEFGTISDLKALTQEAHGRGMHVILDWVADHTSWDNNLTVEHPDFYKRDSTGRFVSPFDWSDVIQLDYDNKALWDYMIGAMTFWLDSADVDGFRCDVAAMVPTVFWDTARAHLNRVKPVFMLAEAEEPELLVDAFDMDYGWILYHLMNDIAQGKKDASGLTSYFQHSDTLIPKGAYKMYFTSNHDENSWNGTEFERLGDAVKTFAVFSALVPGMPLLYSGQETGLNRRLRFFDKDTIVWNGNLAFHDLYKTLIRLKKDNKALWNGDFGGNMVQVTDTAEKAVFAFAREEIDNRVVAVFNLTPEPQTVTIDLNGFKGNYRDAFLKEEKRLKKKETFSLSPWEYRVYYR
jgi:glycosidase